MRTFSLFFCLGILFVLSQKYLASWGVLSVVGLIAFVCVAALFFYSEHKKKQRAALSIGAFCCAFVYSTLISQSILQQRLPVALEGVDLLVKGRVVNLPEQQERGIRFLFQVEEAHVADTKKPLAWSGKVRLAWYKGYPRQFSAGSTWQLTIRAKRPSGFFNSSGFDYERWLFSQRVIATGYIRTSSENKLLNNNFSIHQHRQTISQAIEQALPESKQLGLIQGLAIAQRSHISTEQWQVLQRTGTSHLLAISGLHIGMVAGVGWLFVWGLGYLRPQWFLLIPARSWALMVGLGFASLYALLAGFTIPTQRAWLMVVILLLGLLWQKNWRASTVISLALLAVLLLDPLAPLSAGFWLSFACVVFLWGLAQRQYKANRWQLLTVQLGLSLAMIPLTAAFFSQVSFVSPLANLIAIPWVSFLVVPFVLLGVASFALFPALAQGLWSIADVSLDYLMQFLTGLSQYDAAAWVLPDVPWYWIACAVLGVFVCLLPKGLPARWLGLILLLPLFSYAQAPFPEGDFKLTVLDVGQGSARIIQTKNHVLIFDAGVKSSDSFDMGKMVILPWLQAQGIKQIDTLMISHADNDHSGGAFALLNELPVQQLKTSALKLFKDYQPESCYTGDRWVWDGVVFEVLHPNQGAKDKKRNNRSCVLRVSNSKHSVLLTGDIEKRAEHQLVNRAGEKLRSDILLVPHHGSRTSSSIGFIKAVDPTLALSSSGYRNRFNHPVLAIQQRYQKLNIPFYDTQKTGEIQLYLSSQDDQRVIQPMRKQESKFWHR